MSKKTFFSVEQIGEDELQVNVSGKGGDLVDMIASVMSQSKEMNQVFKLAMLKVMMNDTLEGSNDESDDTKDMNKFLSAISLGGQVGEA
jgi:hypothetical protein